MASLASAQTLTQIRNVQPRGNALNVVFVSEGFTAAEEARFTRFVGIFADRLVNDEAYAWCANYINVYRLWVPSNESGADDLETGVKRDTYFNAYVSGQFVWFNGADFTRLQDTVRAALPEWTLIIPLVNTGPYPRGTGGGRVAAMTVYDDIDPAILGNTMLHESGHAFANLFDEYTRPGGTTGPTPVYTGPNVSSQSTREGVPWSRFIMPWMPVPTSDDFWYSIFDTDLVGVFQGGAYREDLYRPLSNSKMGGSHWPWGAVNLRAFCTEVHKLKLDHPTAPPTITRQPTGATVTIGQPFTLSVEATALGPVSYQWMFNGRYVSKGQSATYTIPRMMSHLEGEYSVEVTNSAGTTTSAAVRVVAADPPGGRWYSQDIGAVGRAGFAADEVTQKHIHTTGGHIAGTSDAFHFQYQAMTGDGTITAEFVNFYRPNQLPKAGVMLRDSLEPGARYVGIFDVIHTSRIFQSRATVNGDTTMAVTPITTSMPLWWRLQRSGDTFTAWVSPYGSSWTFVGSVTIPGLPATMYAGLAVSTETVNDFATVAFGTVTVTSSGVPPTPRPTIANQSIAGTQNAAVNYQVVASNATRFEVVGATALPAGLAMNALGLVTGTPTAVGSTAVTVRASNATGSADAQLSINVTAAPSPLPAIANQSIAATQNTPLSYQLVASNTTRFDIVGPTPLPAGLSISTSGLVTGTPTAVGSTAVIVRASNASGSAEAELSIAITAASNPPPPPPPSRSDQTITFSSPVSAIVVGQPVQLGAISSAGLPITYSVISGDATIAGNTLTPTSTATLVVRAASAGNDEVNPASVEVNFGAPRKASQSITFTSTSRTVKPNATTSLDATSSSGLPVTYTLVSGPATLTGNALTITGTSGTVTIRASQAGNATYDAANDLTLEFTITPIPTSRLVNISSRLRVSANDSNGASIAGFVITGASAKQILIRAVGPSLSTYGINNPLAAPQLTLFDAKNAVVTTNAGWANDAQVAAVGTSVGAFPLTPNSSDAALLVTLTPGAYTTQVQSANTGTALIEVYDAAANATSPTKQLINISTRGTVGTGDDVLIGGFVISGDQPKRVLVRGIGPGLASYGVSGTLNDPALAIFDAKQVVVARNDNWGTPLPLAPTQNVGSAAEITAANTATGAFALQPDSLDAAIVTTLNPGAYSAVVNGVNNTSGAAMVEIYEVPE